MEREQTAKRNQLQHPLKSCRQIFDPKKTVFVLCSSHKPLPKLLTTENSKKGEGGFFAGIYGMLILIINFVQDFFRHDYEGVDCQFYLT